MNPVEAPNKAANLQNLLSRVRCLEDRKKAARAILESLSCENPEFEISSNGGVLSFGFEPFHSRFGTFGSISHELREFICSYLTNYVSQLDQAISQSLDRVEIK